MTYDDWSGVANFTSKEFGTIYMAKDLISALQEVRNYTGRRINIHSGFRPGDKGYHPLGMAADLDIEKMHVIDQYLVTERFNTFGGIGVYPNWSNPGLHLDVRPKKKSVSNSRWGSFKHGEYVKLNYGFFKQIIERGN